MKCAHAHAHAQTGNSSEPKQRRDAPLHRDAPRHRRHHDVAADGRRPRHRAPALQRRRDPCLACQERRQAHRWAGRRGARGMPMRKHDECARACRRHAALPLPAVDFVAVRARAAVHSAAAVAPTSAAPVLRLAAAAVLLFPAARASLSRARVRLACVAAAPPLAAAPLTASYKGAAVGATALARPNGAIATFPSDELCGIVPLGGFQTYSKMDAYRNRQKFNRHNNIARDEE
mmetsp:Transcript_26672/g.77874  ORF Transcript_26672/g.77874 Transcript_26672/m.77874 type:complete len:233 (+) Transcript_26672:1-699(+)